MWKLGLGAADALRLVKRARQCARPNPGFAAQLKLWEAELDAGRVQGAAPRAGGGAPAFGGAAQISIGVSTSGSITFTPGRALASASALCSRIGKVL